MSYGYNNGGGYNRGYNRGNNGYQRPKKKRSGCREKQGKNGKAVIFGWRVTKGQLVSFVASQNNGKHAHAKGGEVIKNGKGQEYTRWTGTVTNKTLGTQSTVSCLYNHATGKLYFPDFGWVANPAAPNGGYFGRSGKPKN